MNTIYDDNKSDSGSDSSISSDKEKNVNNLDNIKESEEVILYNNNSSNEEIKNLKQKIIELESKISHLQKRNNELTKENIRNDTKLKRMSFVGTRKKFFFENCWNKKKIFF